MPTTAAVSLLIKQLMKHFLAVPGGGRSLVGMMSSRNKPYLASAAHCRWCRFLFPTIISCSIITWQRTQTNKRT